MVMVRMFTLFGHKRQMKKRLSTLLSDASGVAIVEFAYVFPFLMVFGMSGIELTNYFLAHRNVSDIAMQVADNASRIGAQTTLVNKPISEREINDLFLGAQMQSGKYDVNTNGRIVLSSVELNPDGGQWIRWQRCFGTKGFNSTLGKEGDGATGNALSSVGSGAGVAARPDSAVMLVQISYTYKPAVSFVPFKFGDIVETAAFNVRDDRDLTKIYNPDKAPVATCS
jgi:hypothetical protein